MNISGIDLNLLRIFDVMMQERSTIRVAERVGLSQPAVSSALARLRHLTRDELFVREGNRMVATAKAEVMHAPVRAAIESLESAFDTAIPFDPETDTRYFRLLGSDYFSGLIMPSLSNRVRPVAPNVVLQMLDMPVSELAGALADARVDLAFGPGTFGPPPWVKWQPILTSWIVTIAAQNDPTLKAAGVSPGERLPPDVFCSIPQVVMSMDGSMRGTIDAPLEQRGLSRKVALTLPHFHSVALAVSEGGFVASLPVHYARQVAQHFQLDLYLPPFDAPFLDINLYWHQKREGDSALSWLRQMIVAHCAERFGQPRPHAEITSAI